MSRPAVIDVVLAGVGGQGSVLATEIVARAAALAGHHVVTSEVHGMAQRGGTVVTTVRFGTEVLAPDVPPGEADFLVAFERLEALRYLSLLRSHGILVVSDQRITPIIESLKPAPYPDDPVAVATARNTGVLTVPALEIARQVGNTKLVGTVLLGALSTRLDIPLDAWATAIRETVPPRTIDLNLEAFRRGADFARTNPGSLSPPPASAPSP